MGAALFLLPLLLLPGKGGAVSPPSDEPAPTAAATPAPLGADGERTLRVLLKDGTVAEMTFPAGSSSWMRPSNQAAAMLVPPTS